MKKIIFLSLTILLLAPIVWAQEQVETPVLNIGDWWKYKNKDGYTWTREVLEVEDKFYIIKFESNANLFGYDKNTLNEMFFIEPGVGGRRKEVTSTFRKLYNFPISVGKEWTDQTTAIPHSGYKKVTYNCEYIVEGIEEVSTPMGVFTTYRIHYKQTNMKSMRSGWINWWYSPKAKSIVKQEIEKNKYWWYWLQDMELISYELKQMIIGVPTEHKLRLFDGKKWDGAILIRPATGG